MGKGLRGQFCFRRSRQLSCTSAWQNIFHLTFSHLNDFDKLSLSVYAISLAIMIYRISLINT